MHAVTHPRLLPPHYNTGLQGSKKQEKNREVSDLPRNPVQRIKYPVTTYKAEKQ